MRVASHPALLSAILWASACGPGPLVQVQQDVSDSDVVRLEVQAGTFETRAENVELLRQVLAGEPTEWTVYASE